MAVPIKCIEKTNSKKIKVQEIGRKAVFENLTRHPHKKIRIDGCVIKNDLAADWLLSKTGIGDIIIELKGKNVEHGAKQCHATADFWTKNNYRQGKIAGLIVSRQYPHASTGIQIAQDRFRRAFRGPLRVVTGERTFNFEEVLNF